MDDVFADENFIEADKKGIIEDIIYYITQGLPSKTDQPIVVSEIPCNRTNTSLNDGKWKNAKGAAAFLCGVLLLSESHAYRNPTGGRFEKKQCKVFYVILNRDV